MKRKVEIRATLYNHENKYIDSEILGTAILKQDYTISDKKFEELRKTAMQKLKRSYSTIDAWEIIITDEEARKLYRINGKWTFAIIVPAERKINNYKVTVVQEEK